MVDENPDPGGPEGVDPHHQEQTRGDWKDVWILDSDLVWWITFGV